MNIVPQKILIIQTAFIGDTILATSVAEEMHHTFPDAKIFLLVKKGNEDLFLNHPYLKIITHDKSKKLSSLFQLIKKIRQEKFDIVINLHRYLSSTLLTILSRARYTSGFQSLLSNFYTYSTPHSFKDNLHEIQRYHELTKHFSKQEKIFLPKLYLQESLPEIFDNKKYVCLFPGSIWATKQLPPTKWIELIQKFSKDIEIYLCGSSQEINLCEYIKASSMRENVHNIAGKYSLLKIAHIMKNALRVYVNDSAPLHIASSLNIPVTAFFCSTITNFGFYPLSDDKQVIEVKNLECRPCGIHGYKKCPKLYFRCGLEINIEEVKVY